VNVREYVGFRRLGLLLPLALVAVASCAGLPNRDPLVVTVAAIEPLPGEGMELNLAGRLRVQNPNDVPLA
jgi:hypothetical protein